MWISETLAVAIAAGAVRPIMLARIEGDPVTRAWTGVGDLEIAADEIETVDGAVYKGVGLFADWPPLEVLLNGEAGRLSFLLSGIDAMVQALFERELAELEGAVCDIGLSFLDERQQMMATPRWIKAPEIEDAEHSQDRTPGGMTRAVAVGMIYGSQDRRRPLYAYYSPPNQAARSPGDLFCERTPLYNADHTVSWPRFGS